MQFIPIVERVNADLIPLANLGWGARGTDPRPLYLQSGNHVTDRSVRPEQLGMFLVAIFDEWVPPRCWHGLRPALRHHAGRAPGPVFTLRLLAHLRRCGCAGAYRRPLLLRPLCRAGLSSSAISAIRTWPIWSRRRGSATSAPTSRPRYRRTAAPATCCSPATEAVPKDRFISTPDGEPGLNYLCAGYKKFFQHVEQPMRLMASLLEASARRPRSCAGYAIEDAKWRTEAAKVGRNEPCPCGSGRKAKHCHAA